MTRQDFIDQHRQNVEWVNGHIRICRLARRLLKGIAPSSYAWRIREANEPSNQELAPLKALIESEPYRESYRLRFESYGSAILSTVFDVRKWIYEARMLRLRAQEFPWLIAS